MKILDIGLKLLKEKGKVIMARKHLPFYTQVLPIRGSHFSPSIVLRE